ncbi:putative adenylyltransferase/sulfurtransferase MoeZ [Pseudodesulfovibrio hydrargyri]|uniref:Putative adenylyltransferase/sulfurtransferase MoeZ n=1 Tax=Pseudodesulfovibrio hydrargyri TaxID=2125990 RepID=A0A1J5NKF6_9BACT|nr:rhodanese-like domain-containing protein [Pseudodesulfovibrio hydrargyri]OIQ52137.1 putative adenylyltransferase/sulfurtransferase MoeZ [Pseudodesulfovibrio hydrargyri]
MNPRYIVLILAALSVAFLLYRQYGQAAPEGVAAVSAAEARAALAADPDIRVLDIRTPAEYAEGHVRGALNIDFMGADFVKRLGELDPDAKYLVYCRSGNRSARAMKVFGRLGFTRILHMSKGIRDWQGQGLPLVR